MLSELQMHDHLTEFLAPHGRNVDELDREVGRSFGTPGLVVASGSVLQGFGNRTSDVDLHAVVDDDRVTDFHLSFHEMGFAVDVNYVGEAWLRAAAEHALRGARARPRNRSEWKEEERRLIQLGRFALGLPLAGEADWREWQRTLAAGFADYAAWWWVGETLRARTAAELLVEESPLLACWRYCDAGLAALNALAARAGEPYPSTKWLGLKFTKLGRADLSRVLDGFLDLPSDTEGAAEYLADARSSLSTLTADWGLPDDPTVFLTPAPGVDVWRIRDRHLVHRYALSGVEVTGGVRHDAVSAELTAVGPLSGISDIGRMLATKGMCWICCWESVS